MSRTRRIRSGWVRRILD